MRSVTFSHPGLVLDFSSLEQDGQDSQTAYGSGVENDDGEMTTVLRDISISLEAEGGDDNKAFAKEMYSCEDERLSEHSKIVIVKNPNLGSASKITTKGGDSWTTPKSQFSKLKPLVDALGRCLTIWDPFYMNGKAGEYMKQVFVKFVI